MLNNEAASSDDTDDQSRARVSDVAELALPAVGFAFRLPLIAEGVAHSRRVGESPARIVLSCGRRATISQHGGPATAREPAPRTFSGGHDGWSCGSVGQTDNEVAPWPVYATPSGSGAHRTVGAAQGRGEALARSSPLALEEECLDIRTSHTNRRAPERCRPLPPCPWCSIGWMVTMASERSIRVVDEVSAAARRRRRSGARRERRSARAPACRR
jgi:hypothetical protein